jgi:hypothetical protein
MVGVVGSNPIVPTKFGRKGRLGDPFLLGDLSGLHLSGSILKSLFV